MPPTIRTLLLCEQGEERDMPLASGSHRAPAAVNVCSGRIEDLGRRELA
jgi:hypothetical protein